MSRILTFIFLLLALVADAQPRLTSEPLTFHDAAGRFHQPFLLNAGKKAVALIFIANDCPISNSYAPEINRITATYAARGIVFYLISVDSSVSPSAVAKHAREYGFRCPVLLDGSHILVHHTGVAVTPEAAIYTTRGLQYRGRIDDKYAGFGQVRFAATCHDLRDALDAIVMGRPPPHHTTKAIGCPI